MRLTLGLVASAVLLVVVSGVATLGQRGGAFRASRDHPAIQYSSGPTDNVVVALNRELREGMASLVFAGRSGYLTSVLDALKVPVESQITVFSKTSFQASEINSKHPRTLFFADTVAVAWVPDAEFLELAVQDRRQGVMFYTLRQDPAAAPQFVREEHCLACHLSWDTLGVPGLQVLSTAPLSSDPNAYATGFVSDHRSPLVERWGGYYVTGSTGGVAHMGNIEVTDVDDPPPSGTVPPELQSLDGLFDSAGYLSLHSDVVALMVLEHQAHMTNLVTRLGWETRRVGYRDPANDTGFDELVRDAAIEFVDYMLFIDEAPLPRPIAGTSGFAEWFAAREPRDSQGRSLREFDLKRWLFRYPCSYMIYTPAFDALPELARDAVYARLWEVLSGDVADERYARLSLSDRRAVVDILLDTKPELPVFFDGVVR